MNLSKGTEMLLEELKFVATADVVKPLPWRSVRTPLPLDPADDSLVPHAEPTSRNYPPDLLVEPTAIVPLPHLRLGRVPERTLGRLGAFTPISNPVLTRAALAGVRRPRRTLHCAHAYGLGRSSALGSPHHDPRDRSAVCALLSWHALVAAVVGSADGKGDERDQRTVGAHERDGVVDHKLTAARGRGQVERSGVRLGSAQWLRVPEGAHPPLLHRAAS